MRNRLTERDLSRIVRRVIKEDEKTMKDISDDFLEDTFKKISRIVMLPEFSDIEDILGKTVGNDGSNIGNVLEKIYKEAISRRKNKKRD
jgi:hypothetical protein